MLQRNIWDRVGVGGLLSPVEKHGGKQGGLKGILWGRVWDNYPANGGKRGTIPIFKT